MADMKQGAAESVSSIDPEEVARFSAMAEKRATSSGSMLETLSAAPCFMSAIM